MKIAFYTLGCKVNQYESNEMMVDLRQKGYTVVDTKDNADIYVINSCTVTAESSRKTRQAVRRFKHEHPDSIVVLTGCYPQAFSDEIKELNEADIVLGNKTNSLLCEAIEHFISNKQKQHHIIAHKREDAYSGGTVSEFEGHTRAYIKIQDGCNRYCTYCIIPKSRGFSRSKPLDKIKNELESIAAHGYKEVVFVGINLSAYGLESGKNIADALLLAQNTPGIERFRLGSLEPDHITDEVISKLSEMDKFCPQFHLSLQSGCDKVLKKMNRHYNTREYIELCTKLKKHFPDLSLTTDIIVGFPGETDEDFMETVDFAKEIGFMKIHVFPFSPRKGTPAYNYGEKISNNIKASRCKYLQTQCDTIRKDFMKSFVGKTVDVLFETPKNGLQHGYTKNYTPVYVHSETPLSGEIRKVFITKSEDDCCIGNLI